MIFINSHASFGLKYKFGRKVMSELLQKDELIIQEVITAAKELFKRYGLKKTTMEDIAKYVGKGKSTLYYYFPSKQEIFEAVVEHEMKELFRSIEIAAENAPTAREKLKVYCTTRFEKLAMMCNLSQVLKEDIMDNACTIFQLKKKHSNVEINLVREFLAFGVKSGEFRVLSDEHYDILAKIIVATFRGFELPNLEVLELPKDFSTYTDFMIETFIEGFGQKNG